MKKSSFRPETQLVHHPRERLADDNQPLVGGVFRSMKFELGDWDRFREDPSARYIYSRASNPTVRELERTLAQLQGCDDAIAVASGVAALAIPLLSLLSQGDHACLFYESYPPTRTLLQTFLAKFGVRHTILSVSELDRLAKVIQEEKTRLIVFESPTNPMLAVADVRKITSLARDAGALTLFDNTFAGFHNYHDVGVDLYVHSLSKYANGHGDVMGGAIIGDQKSIGSIRKDSVLLGPTLDPDPAFMIQRGLKTYFLRYQRECENAFALAQWLEKQAFAKNVRYPGLPSHPDHALAADQQKDFGTVVTFDVAKAHSTADFFRRLKLFHPAASLGSLDSLIAPVAAFYAADFDEPTKQRLGITPQTYRLSIGIESVDDLMADLEQALS